MTQTPESEHDWFVHVLNIHGAFFERWCRRTILQTGNWYLAKTEYPVVYPIDASLQRQQESALDILAETNLRRARLAAIIECKKNNPEFVNWIFLARQVPHGPGPVVVSHLTAQVDHGKRNIGWFNELGLKESFTSLPIVDEGREVRSSYHDYKGGNKTKTSNTAITEAAIQVALATQFVSWEKYAESEAFSNQAGRVADSYPIEVNWFFLPIIVTTAKLAVCRFSAQDVSETTGELSYDKVECEDTKAVVYEYPIPRHLQRFTTGTTEWSNQLIIDKADGFTKMHIIVINSQFFEEGLISNFWIYGLE